MVVVCGVSGCVNAVCVCVPVVCFLLAAEGGLAGRCELADLFLTCSNLFHEDAPGMFLGRGRFVFNL